ncbi:MAG: YitT family protein [Oscillospiraceae bacterium]|nr:YitT family protein [Oscillospiraceae bacterium]
MITRIKKIAYIVFAIALLGISVNMFVAPHDTISGGLTGLAIMIEVLTGLDRAVMVLGGNILILIITLIFLDKEVFFNTVLGSLLLPVSMWIVPRHMIIENTLFSIIIGGLIIGIGFAILYHNSASSGGTTVPPLIFKKYFKLKTSIGLFLTETAVLALAIYVFTIEAFFLALFLMFIASVTVHYTQLALNKKQLVHIVSEMNKSIVDDILSGESKGIFIVPSFKASDQNIKELRVITSGKKNHERFLEVVKKHDDKAFIITTEVSDVQGDKVEVV